VGGDVQPLQPEPIDGAMRIVVGVAVDAL